MRLLWAVMLVLSPALATAQRGQSAQYFPPAEPVWETRRPEQVGMDAAKLQEAIAFAKQNESTAPRDLEMAHYSSFGREPFGYAIGPFKERGPQTGIIIRNGYIVAEWGEPQRVDMTFSVTKSFVSTMVGLAFDRGMIRDVNDPVHTYMAPIFPMQSAAHAVESNSTRLGGTRPIELFATEHNRRITWDHLLRQVSDWEGTLWGKPEWADRPDRDATTWLTRARKDPGSAYEYNDTRVNVLALAATNVWRRPLPEVLRELVMDPIGASPTWRWYGYDNSWIVVDGKAVQAVGGGGHWGGGMFISARDQARFGLLTLRNGRWNGTQLISEKWLQQARTPTPAEPGYGYMNFFLNTDKKRYPAAPASIWAHLGNGTNIVYCDPVNDIVIVARWIQDRSINEFLGKVLASLTQTTP